VCGFKDDDGCMDSDAWVEMSIQLLLKREKLVILAWKHRIKEKLNRVS